MTSPRPRLVMALIMALMSSIILLASQSNDGELAHAVDSAPSQASSDLRLELLEQDFSFEADGTIHLVYRLIGDLEKTAELTATTTTTPSATTAPTTPPPTTLPTDTAPGEPGPPETAAPPATPPTTTVPPPPPLVQLTIEITNYSPIRTTTAIDRVVGSDVSPTAFNNVIDGVSLTDLRSRVDFASDGSATFTLDIKTDVVDSVEEKLKFDQPGLYPIRLEILIGDPSRNDVLATAGTIVQRLPGPNDPELPGSSNAIPDTNAPPINLAVVTATPPVGPTANASDSRSARTAMDNAIGLAATLESPVTLQVPPTQIAGKAEIPGEQRKLADDLADDEFVPLPLAPLDVSSAAAVGLSDTYARLLAAGEDLLTSAVPTTPSRRDIWLASDPLSAAGAQQLRDLGVRFVVMPQELFRETISSRIPATDQFVNIRLPDGGTLSLLIVDGLSDQLTPEATDETLIEATPTEWAVETAATMLIDQALSDQQNGEFTRASRSANRSRALTTPDLRAPDERLLIGLEELVATTPGIRFTPGSLLTGVTDTQTSDGQPVAVELPATAGPSLAARIELIDSTRLRMVSAASMLTDDDPRLAEWNEELDALVSTGYTDAEVEESAEDLLEQADQLKSAVALPEPFTFTLTGRSGTIEIRMHNNIDEPLEVLLQFSSPKINFPQGDRIITLRPSGETSVIVPVEARSNGTSSIDVQVSTPSGELLAEPISLTSRVTALTGLGQLLTVGFALVLLTWWFTHWRSKRRVALADDGRNRHPTSKQ